MPRHARDIGLQTLQYSLIGHSRPPDLLLSSTLIFSPSFLGWAFYGTVRIEFGFWWHPFVFGLDAWIFIIFMIATRINNFSRSLSFRYPRSSNTFPPLLHMLVLTALNNFFIWAHQEHLSTWSVFIGIRSWARICIHHHLIGRYWKILLCEWRIWAMFFRLSNTSMTYLSQPHLIS